MSINSVYRVLGATPRTRKLTSGSMIAAPRTSSEAARAGRATEFCSDFPESVRTQYLEPVQGPRASYANCHGSWDPCECHDQPDGVCDFVHIMRPAKAGAFLSWLGHFLVAIVSASLVVVTLLAREREMRLTRGNSCGDLAADCCWLRTQ